MWVGTLEVELQLEGMQSLKDKRKVIRSLNDRIHRRFRVSIAEVDSQDLWGNATIGAAVASGNQLHADSVMQHVLDEIDADANLVVVSALKQVNQI